MTTLDLLYGHGHVQVSLPDANLLGVLEPRRPGQPADETALLRGALAQPIGTPRLRDLARAGQRVVIVTSDLTRPCPSERLLPYLLDELQAAGVPDTDITVARHSSGSSELPGFSAPLDLAGAVCRPAPGET